jgi:hypothetical protein
MVSSEIPTRGSVRKLTSQKAAYWRAWKAASTATAMAMMEVVTVEAPETLGVVEEAVPTAVAVGAVIEP